MDDKQYPNNTYDNSSQNQQTAPTSQQVQSTPTTRIEQEESLISPPNIQPITSPLVQPKNRKIQPKTIVTSFLVIIVLTLAGFIVYKTLFNNNLSPKSFSQFDHIIKGLGYEKVESEVAEYSDSRGGYVTYIKQDGTMADGMAMFYDVESKEYLKELVNSSMEEDYDLATLFEDFDWSKNYNKKEMCSKNNAQTYICINTVQVENTLLFVLYHSNSEDKVRSEIDNVISAMGYNQR